MTQTDTSGNDSWVAPKDTFRGNLYVELPGNRPWERDDRNALVSSCRLLARRYPAIAAAARDHDVAVEQFLLDTMFADLLPAPFSMAKLTYESEQRRVEIDVALRLDADARPGWPLPKGVSLVAKAHWQLQGVKKQTGDVYTNRNPVLRIYSFHDGPPGEARPFEVRLDATCRQVARMEPGANKERNVLTPELGEELPPMSDLTGDRLKDWSDFLQWKERLIHATRESLRYTSRVLGSDQRSIVFTVVGSDEASLERAANGLKRNLNLGAFELSLSEDEWVFQPPKDAREPSGIEIGRAKARRRRIEPMADPASTPWPNAVTAQMSFSISDDALTSIDTSEDPTASAEQALRRIPESGFILQSAYQDLAQIKRQSRALADLSDQGGYSPYLARFIFDAAEARTPTSLTRVDEWVNGQLNTAQRSAVEKILSAPDLCLIQGPPGTGKTTVIAEAITQLAKRDESVLLASQTHTAVDNALSRLPFHPGLRAVRLTRNEGRVGDEGQEFLNDRALGRYYRSLAAALQAKRDITLSEQRFAERFTRLALHATALIDALEAAERQQTKAAQDARKAERDLMKLVRDLEEQARIHLPGADESTLDGSRFERLSQSLEDLGPSLDDVEELMTAVSAGQPATTGRSVGGRRDELEAQLLDVLEQMKTDQTVVSDYQRIQTELSSLDERSGSSPGSVRALRTYFPDAERLIDDPRNSKAILAEKAAGLIGRGKRAKAARDVLERIGLVREATPSIDRARFTVAARRRAMAEAAEQLTQVQNQTRSHFETEGRDLLLGAEVDSPPTAKSLRDYLQRGQERVTAATHAAAAGEAWADIEDDWITDLGRKDVALRDWEEISNDWLAECNVVGVTCNENPRTLDDAGLTNFDLTIIDEVSKATPLELLMPLMRARRSALVGDHRQLPPMFREGQDAEGITEESDVDVPEEFALTPENLRKYEKFVTASLFRQHFERADETIKERLTIQHRMHPDIMKAVNLFYEGQLTSGIKDPDSERSHGLTITGRGDLPVISPDRHIVWIDTTFDDKGEPWREPRSDSAEARTNLLEARLIVALLREMDDALAADPTHVGRRKDVGIVSMYQAQVRCIGRELEKAKKRKSFKVIRYELNTVVKYQGKEKPIVLVSMVRNLGPSSSKRRRSSRANVARFEYINVAFSRAQELLVVFGARDTFAPYAVELPPMNSTGAPTSTDVYRQICDTVERHGALKQASAVGDGFGGPIVGSAVK